VAELLYRLGKLSAKRAVVILVSWLVLLVLAGGAYLLGAGTLSSNFDIPGTATDKVASELASKLPDYSGASAFAVYHTDNDKPFTAREKLAIGSIATGAVDLPNVTTASDPFTTESKLTAQKKSIANDLAMLDSGAKQLAAGQKQLDAGQKQLTAAIAAAKANGTYAYAKATFTAQQAKIDAQQKQIDTQSATIATDRKKVETGSKLLALADGITTVSSDGTTAILNVDFNRSQELLPAGSKTKALSYFDDNRVAGVSVSLSSTIGSTIPEIIGVSEVAGFVIAGIVLLIMLGTFVAAGLPLLNALIGVGVGVLFCLSLSGVIDESQPTPVLGVMLGLAVGIDYSLFIINRHRRQLRQGMELYESIGLATGTAGNAVVFAGTTVVVALVALNVTGIPFIGVMGSVGAVSVAIAVLVAITLTPAMLRFVGMRVLTKKALTTVGHESHVIGEVKPMSTIRAILTVIVTIGVLLTIAIPALSLRLGLPDASSDPVNTTTYKSYTLAEKKFGPGINAELVVTTALPPGLSSTQITDRELRFAQRIHALKHVAAVAPIGVSKDKSLVAFAVLPTTGPNDVATENLVVDIRAMTANGTDTHLGVAGVASGNIDISAKLAGALPIYIALVVGLSLIILIGVFRSLLVPIIATGGFILSLLADYGVLVAVFQWGWLASVFGIHSLGPVLNFLPIILVGILFGLAMDYQLFLASGMREAYIHGATARVAVMRGFRAGRTVVIAAAIIMISVFGGFIFSDSIFIVALGLGLASGVLFDAFIVRMLLMPALMHLLGRSAWWIPRWLDRILPNLDIEGASLERVHHAV
jgi:RND superfamily putative drug exporter